MKISSNGLNFDVEIEGPERAPAVLLTMGLGMQLTAWPATLVDALVQAGFRVIRYDNRDVGLSDKLDHLGQPNLLWQFLRQRLVPVACGRDTAKRIPGARFEAIEGMGHDWPPAVAELLAHHIFRT